MSENTYLVISIQNRIITGDITSCDNLDMAIEAANRRLTAHMHEYGMGAENLTPNTQWAFADKTTLHAHSDYDVYYDVYILNSDDFTRMLNMYAQTTPDSIATPTSTQTIRHKTIHIKPSDRLKKNGRKVSRKKIINTKISKFLHHMSDEHTPVKIINIETKIETRQKPGADSLSDTEQHIILTIWYERIEPNA